MFDIFLAKLALNGDILAALVIFSRNCKHVKNTKNMKKPYRKAADRGLHVLKFY